MAEKLKKNFPKVFLGIYLFVAVAMIGALIYPALVIKASVSTDFTVTNNGNTTAGPNYTDHLVMQFDLPDPSTHANADVILRTGTAQDVAAGNSLASFAANDKFADDDHDDDTADYADGLLVVNDAGGDNSISSAEIITDGTADLTSTWGNIQFGDEDHDDAQDYDGNNTDVLLVDSANNIIVSGEIIHAGLADLNAFPAAYYYLETDADSTFDNGEDIIKMEHNGANATADGDTIDLFGVNDYYSDADSNTTFTGGELIVSSPNANLESTDTITTGGTVKNNVALGGTNYYGAGAPYCVVTAAGGNIVAGDTLVSDSCGLGYGDNYTFTCGAEPECGTAVGAVVGGNDYFIDDNTNAVHNTGELIWQDDGDGDLEAGEILQGSSTSALTSINNSISIFYNDNNTNTSYDDGEDIFVAYFTGTLNNISGSDVIRIFDAAEKFSDENNDSDFTVTAVNGTPELIANSADANLATIEVVTDGYVDVTGFAGNYQYSDVDNDGVYDEGDLIADSVDSILSGPEIKRDGNVDLNGFHADTRYYDTDTSISYTDQDDIVYDKDQSTYYDADQLSSIQIGSSGTCIDADLAKITIWEDTNNNNTFDSGADTAIGNDSSAPFIGQTIAVTHTVYTASSAERTIFASIDTVASPTDGCTFIARIPQNGAVMLSNNDGPTDTVAATTDTITIDAAAPVLQSFTSTTGDGTYGPTSTINVTATYDESIAGGSTMTVTLSNGQSVALNVVAGATISGTYTVGATGSGQDVTDITVSAINAESATDLYGNTRTNSGIPGTNIATGSDINVDTTAPLVVVRQTSDNDGNGKIDRIIVAANEPLDDDFSGLTVDVTSFVGEAYVTGTAGNDNTFHVTFTENANPCNLTSQTGCDTDVTPNIQITANTSLSDAYGNNIAVDGAPVVSTDAANPIVIARYTDDNDGNGQIDRIGMITSESLNDNFTDIVVAVTAPAYTVTGYITGAGANDDVFLATLTESGAPDTSVTPNVQITANTLLQDSASLPIQPEAGPTAATDTAPPVALNGTYIDADGDGTLDRTDIAFSENVTYIYQDSDWTPTANSITSYDVTACASCSNVASLQLTTIANAKITGGLVQPALAYVAGNNIVDGSANNAADFTFAALIDGAAPVPVTADYDDLDSDGQVDRLDVTMTNDTGLVCTWDATDWSLPAAGSINASLAGTCSVVGNDIQLTLNADVNETGGAVDPRVRYQNLNTAGSVADGIGNQTGDFGAFGVTATDSANPIMQSMQYLDLNNDGTIEILRINISTENFTNGIYNAGDWTLVANDITGLTITGINNFGASAIDLDVTANANITGAVANNEPTLSFLPGNIQDGNANNLQTWVATTVNDAASPRVLSGVYTDNNSDGMVDQVIFTTTTDNGMVCTAFTGGVDFLVNVGGTVNIAAGGGDTCASNGTTTVTFGLSVPAAVNTTGGGVDPQVTYTQPGNGIEDGAGNDLATAAGVTVTDNAAPIPVSALYLDTDVDGDVDRIDLTMTSDVGLACTLEGADWSFPNDGDFDLNTPSTCTVVGNDLRINVTSDANETGSAISPTILYTNQGTLNQVADAAANFTATFTAPVTVVDSAPPLILSGYYDDVNSDGAVDRVYFNTTTDTGIVCTGFAPTTDFTVNTAGTVNVTANFTDLCSSNGTNNIDIVIQPGTAATTGGAVAPDVNYTQPGNGVEDGAGNDIPSAVAVALTDGADILPVSAVYLDTNSDGTVDQVDLTMTADVGMSCNFEAGDWSFPTPGDNTLNTPTTCTVNGNDLQIAVSADANETGSNVTNPTVSYANVGATNSIKDGASNPTVTFAAPVTVTDQAPPVIISATPTNGSSGIGVTTGVVATFSETMNTGTVTQTSAPDPGGWSVGWSFNNTVATYSHANFAYNTLYTETITAGDDMVGLSLVAGPVLNGWTFTSVNPGGGGGGGGGGASAPYSTYVIINDGNDCTASKEVVLTLEAKNAYEVLVSNDENFVGADWMSFSSPNSISWTLTEGEGTKTVYARYKAVSGTISAKINDEINYTTTCQEETPEVPPEEVTPEEPTDQETSDYSIGDLIKRADNSAIYYYGSDGKRHPFPNETVYFSWYADFSGVKTVSAEALASIQLAKNVTMRPGTWLIKIKTNPKVYAIEPGGVIRWITTEDIAKRLYGDDFASLVRDVGDTFFMDYTEGADIDSYVHPDGTLVKYRTYPEIFYIQDGQKRWVDSESTFYANGLQWIHVLTIPDTQYYSNGTDVIGWESDIASIY